MSEEPVPGQGGSSPPLEISSPKSPDLIKTNSAEAEKSPILPEYERSQKLWRLIQIAEQFRAAHQEELGKNYSGGLKFKLQATEWTYDLTVLADGNTMIIDITRRLADDKEEDRAWDKMFEEEEKEGENKGRSQFNFDKKRQLGAVAFTYSPDIIEKSGNPSLSETFQRQKGMIYVTHRRLPEDYEDFAENGKVFRDTRVGLISTQEGPALFSASGYSRAGTAMGEPISNIGVPTSDPLDVGEEFLGMLAIANQVPHSVASVVE